MTDRYRKRNAAAETAGVSIRSTDGCNIEFETNVTTPNAAVLATVQKGDALDLKMELTLLGRKSVKLLSVLKNQLRVGDLDHELVHKVVACIEKGVEFEAYVLKVDSGYCLVSVQRK